MVDSSVLVAGAIVGNITMSERHYIYLIGSKLYIACTVCVQNTEFLLSWKIITNSVGKCEYWHVRCLQLESNNFEQRRGGLNYKA